MSKAVKIYIGLLVLLFIGATFIEFSRLPPINWTPTYNETHKLPYGTYVLYNELENIFPESKVKNIEQTPYEYFDQFYDWSDSTYMTKGTYMLISNYREIDDVSAQELLDFASHGNDVFFSSNYIPQKFKDSLNIEITEKFNFNTNATFSLANSRFTKDSISIKKATINNYFSELDTLNTTILGYQKFDSISRVNFIKINHVYGNIYLHLQPIAFTNYILLKNDKKKYAEAVLSYLSDEDIHYEIANKIRQNLGSSPLRFILSKPALRSAWYLALIALVFFMIFNAKRKQRIIKIIKPLTNTTLAFTRTIGNLYYETKDHNNLTFKKTTYFLEYVRRTYFLNTDTLDEKFIKSLAQKSGKHSSDIKKLINLIIHLQAKSDCTENDLLALNKSIEAFYKK